MCPMCIEEYTNHPNRQNRLPWRLLKSSKMEQGVDPHNSYCWILVLYKYDARDMLLDGPLLVITSHCLTISYKLTDTLNVKPITLSIYYYDKQSHNGSNSHHRRHGVHWTNYNQVSIAERSFCACICPQGR